MQNPDNWAPDPEKVDKCCADPQNLHLISSMMATHPGGERGRAEKYQCEECMRYHHRLVVGATVRESVN